jgi:hypothetical protein
MARPLLYDRNSPGMAAQGLLMFSLRIVNSENRPQKNGRHPRGYQPVAIILKQIYVSWPIIFFVLLPISFPVNSRH